MYGLRIDQTILVLTLTLIAVMLFGLMILPVIVAIASTIWH